MNFLDICQVGVVFGHILLWINADTFHLLSLFFQ
jgi:hypothetical protein